MIVIQDLASQEVEVRAEKRKVIIKDIRITEIYWWISKQKFYKKKNIIIKKYGKKLIININYLNNFI